MPPLAVRPAEAATRRDHDLCATISGLTASWTVEGVELDAPRGRRARVTRAEGAPAQCPEGRPACATYDHRERERRPVDTCQLRRRLHVGVPRVDRPTRGVVQTAVPWATAASRPGGRSRCTTAIYFHCGKLDP